MDTELNIMSLQVLQMCFANIAEKKWLALLTLSKTVILLYKIIILSAKGGKMCECCRGELTELIKSDKVDELQFGWDSVASININNRQDNSVMMEVRGNCGYIRLGDREDMQCLDHGEYIKVNYCPICGSKISK